jgi:hypothetical protein
MESHSGVSPLQGVRCLSQSSRHLQVERDLSYCGRFSRSWWCRSSTFFDEGYEARMSGLVGAVFDFKKGKLINTVECQFYLSGARDRG